MNWEIYINALYTTLILAALTWLISVIKRDVSIVDAMWSIMFLGAASLITFNSELSERGWLIYTLLAAWALRLSIHIIIRSWGEPEDSRYQDIREKYSPNFALKSLFIIFVFQAVLAWLVLAPIIATLPYDAALSTFDYVAAAIVLFGILYEGIADFQLARFKAASENKGKVMDRGLWKYSRHPNYFGEFIIWWGFFIFAASQAHWASIVSPLLMSFLLLKFSGVGLMESTITDRKPAYKKYIETTNAFFPGPRKTKSPSHMQGVSS